MDIDLTIQVNKLYDQYKNEDANWKGIAEYFSQEEIEELERKDNQNTEFRFKQFAVQHYAMNKMYNVLESYVGTAYILQKMIGKEFTEKYSTKIMNISNELIQSGIELSQDTHHLFVKETIEHIQKRLHKREIQYAEKLPELKIADYYSN